MSEITFNNIKAGIVKGATWYTEADVTSGGILLRASAIKVNADWESFTPRDIGFSGFKTGSWRVAHNCQVDITCDVTYEQAWIGLQAFLFATESSPVEQTTSQADYLRTIDLAEISSLFFTLMYSIETDRTLSMYSVKPYSMSLNLNLGKDAGTVTFKCMADRVVEGSQNTVSEISALTSYEWSPVILGGQNATNHYFRIADYSTGTALDSGDDKTITGVTITVDRPLSPKRGLAGVNSPYISEPKQLGVINGTLSVRYDKLENSAWDMFGNWQAGTYYMAELFVDGAIIGSTVNRSLKYQFPYLKPSAPMPTGHDFSSNTGEFLPSITFDMFQAPSAPSGMSGVTNYLRCTSISPTRSTKWTA